MQVAFAALFLASAVLRVEQQLQKVVVVSDCYQVEDSLRLAVGLLGVFLAPPTKTKYYL